MRIQKERLYGYNNQLPVKKERKPLHSEVKTCIGAFILIFILVLIKVGIDLSKEFQSKNPKEENLITLPYKPVVNGNYWSLIYKEEINTPGEIILVKPDEEKIIKLIILEGNQLCVYYPFQNWEREEIYE